MALRALEEAQLDQLLLVPAFCPPNKANTNLTEYVHRLAMLELACKPYPNLTVSDIERHLPVPSYTLRTLQALFGDPLPAHIPFLMGLDTFLTLPQWYEPRALIETLHFLVVPRASATVPTTLPLDSQSVPVSVQVIEGFRDDAIASTPLRQWLASGKTSRSDDYYHWLDPEVYDYIQTHHLYTPLVSQSL